MKHHGGGGKAAKGFGADRIRTLVSTAADISHRLIMGKMLSNQYRLLGGWAGRWCWVASSAVLLLLHIVGQGPVVLAAGAGRVGYIFFLSSLPNVLSFGRQLNMTKILWFRLLSVVVSYCRGHHRLVLVNRLENLSLPRNSATIN